MDWILVKEGLMLMLKGMVGIFLVMLIIYIFILILSKLTNKE